MRSMTSVWLYRVLCVGLALAVVGAWGAPTPAGAQGGLVPADIAGTVTVKNGSPSDRTVTASCSYRLPPFTGTFTATPDSANGSYTIAAMGEVSRSNCIVKVNPCPGSTPIQTTVRIPPSVSGVNFTCNS